jgi:hypothetical protein
METAADTPVERRQLSSHTTGGAFVWVLYDGRADGGDTDDASVLEAFSSRKDLKNSLYRNWNGHDGVLYEYDDHGGKLMNQRRIGHLREGKGALMSRCSRQAPLSDETVTEDK